MFFTAYSLKLMPSTTSRHTASFCSAPRPETTRSHKALGETLRATSALQGKLFKPGVAPGLMGNVGLGSLARSAQGQRKGLPGAPRLAAHMRTSLSRRLPRVPALRRGNPGALGRLAPREWERRVNPAGWARARGAAVESRPAEGGWGRLRGRSAGPGACAPGRSRAARVGPQGPRGCGRGRELRIQVEPGVGW